MPSETNAMLDLENLLNSDVGKAMTADQLADMSPKFSERIKGCGVEVKLPVTNVNTLPLNGVCYKAADSGSTLVFDLTERDDSLPNVGMVTMELFEDVWGHARKGNGAPDSVSYFVQSRGKGIYTIYTYDTDRIMRNYGDQSPLFEGRLLFVYPGADSILVHRGCEENKRVFRIEQ